MDIFVEKLVKRKKSGTDYVYIAGIAVLALILILLVFSIPALQRLTMLLSVVIIYGAYLLISGKNIEFEYALTNGELDIDKIINKKRRKSVLSVNCKDFEIFAKLNSEHYDKSFDAIKLRIDATSSMKSPDVYFAVFMDDKEKVIFFFEPNEKMVDGIKKANPRNVYA